MSDENLVHVPLSVAEAFEDLETRFLLNLPDIDELRDSARLFFQLEQAWWFYEDFLADKYDHLPHFKKFDAFSSAMFQYCNILEPHKPRYQQMLQEFKGYMQKIPVYGAILLNNKMDSVVLVQSYGGKSWGFPKGKVNEGEKHVDCALREVAEEIGFEVQNSEAIYDEKDFIENTTKQGKKTTLFIIRNVPETFQFEPRVRKEIGEIKWFKIAELPVNRDSKDEKEKDKEKSKDKDSKESSSKFWQVHTFIPLLKKWIRRKQGPSKGKSRAEKDRPNSRAKKGAKSKTDSKQEQEKEKPKNEKKTSKKKKNQQSQHQVSIVTPTSAFQISIDVQSVMKSMKPFLTSV